MPFPGACMRPILTLDYDEQIFSTKYKIMSSQLMRRGLGLEDGFCSNLANRLWCRVLPRVASATVQHQTLIWRRNCCLSVVCARKHPPHLQIPLLIAHCKRSVTAVGDHALLSQGMLSSLENSTKMLTIL